MTDYRELIEELEGAEYGTLDLDMRVFDAVRNHDIEVVRAAPRSFTTSVDAAMCLVPDSLVPSMYTGVDPDGEEEVWCVSLSGDYTRCDECGSTGYKSFDAWHLKLPLAICIAALKARSEEEIRPALKGKESA